MKKILLTLYIVCELSIGVAFCQDGDNVNVGPFLLRKEYKTSWGGKYYYNLDSKSDFERQMFSNFNYPVEFYYLPTNEGGIRKYKTGLRMMRDSTDRFYTLDFKRHISDDVDFESKSFIVSDLFALTLHKKMIFVIDKFKVKGIPPLIMGGYSAIFRTIVDDEVWYLKIYGPYGNSLKLSEICIEIMDNAYYHNKFDEAHYLKLLQELYPE